MSREMVSMVKTSVSEAEYPGSIPGLPVFCKKQL